MSITSRATLKASFVDSSIPNEGDHVNLIDSFRRADDGDFSTVIIENMANEDSALLLVADRSITLIGFQMEQNSGGVPPLHSLSLKKNSGGVVTTITTNAIMQPDESDVDVSLTVGYQSLNDVVVASGDVIFFVVDSAFSAVDLTLRLVYK